MRGGCLIPGDWHYQHFDSNNQGMVQFKFQIKRE
jgi:hypothetical protein